MTTIYYVIDMKDKIVATFCMKEDAIDFVHNKEPLCTIREYTFDKDGHGRKAKNAGDQL